MSSSTITAPNGPVAASSCHIPIILREYPTSRRQAKSIRDLFRQDPSYRRRLRRGTIGPLVDVEGVKIPTCGTTATVRYDGNTVGRLPLNGKVDYSATKLFLLLCEHDDSLKAIQEKVKQLLSQFNSLSDNFVFTPSRASLGVPLDVTRVVIYDALKVVSVRVHVARAWKVEEISQTLGFKCEAIPDRSIEKPVAVNSESTWIPGGSFYDISQLRSGEIHIASQNSDIKPGAEIGFIDTGLKVGTPEFHASDPRVRFLRVDHYGNHLSSDPDDPLGHGTFVITRAAGSKSGLIPDAQIAVAAFPRLAKPEGIMGAFEWLLKHEKLRVINVSLEFYEPGEWDALFRHITQKDSILIFAASGNRGAGHVSELAKIPAVQSVGATICGPAEQVSSLWPYTGHAFTDEKQSDFNPYWVADITSAGMANSHPMSTSIAVPIASAIAAQAIRNDRDPLLELQSCSHPKNVGQAPHQGDTREIFFKADNPTVKPTPDRQKLQLTNS